MNNLDHEHPGWSANEKRWFATAQWWDLLGYRNRCPSESKSVAGRQAIREVCAEARRRREQGEMRTLPA